MSICEDCARQYRCPKTTTDKEVIKCKFYYPKSMTSTITSRITSIFKRTDDGSEHLVLHGYYDLNEEDFEPVYYNPKFLEEMKEIEKEKSIRVNNIDECGCKNVKCIYFDELFADKIADTVKDVAYLKVDVNVIQDRLDNLYKKYDSLKLKVDGIEADNEYLEKKMNYHISENPPISKDVKLSVSTESEKNNDLVEFIREEIKECEELSAIKDILLLRLLKKSILKQLLLDYSARICVNVDDL